MPARLRRCTDDDDPGYPYSENPRTGDHKAQVSQGRLSVFNIHEAKTHLSRLLDRVAQGEEIINREERPVAKLVRVAAEPRRPGRLKGRIYVGPDFEEPLPEGTLAAFHGEGE